MKEWDLSMEGLMDWSKLLNSNRLRTSASKGKTNDPRNEFESDYGRVVFSPAVRRMHDKTQVMPLSTDDNIHTRLTHSLEVATIGESMVLRLVSDNNFVKKTGYENKEFELYRNMLPIVSSACLVHDIGNPPFGHFGEESITSFFEEFFKTKEEEKIKEKEEEEEEGGKEKKCLKLSAEEKEDFLYFDGNAQGFRILTKLQILDDLFGLNLTYATLATYLKYPNSDTPDKEILSKKKRGVFQSEKKYLETIAKECGLFKNNRIIRHPLSFIVEAADTICYRVMDIEDGFNKGWYNFSDIIKFFNAHDNLRNLEIFKNIDDEEDRKSKNIVLLRLKLINLLVDTAIGNFLKNYDEICDGKYNKELVEEDPYQLESVLKKFCIENIFSQREIISLELAGSTVIKGLLKKYIEYVFNEKGSYRNKAEKMISRSILKTVEMENTESNGLDRELTDYKKLRMIVDFISGMTDKYAISHYQVLDGQKNN